MQQVDVSELIRRYDEAKGRSYLYWSLFERCYMYLLPNQQLYDNQTQGANKNAQVYDTTPVKALQKFVSKVQFSICPPGEFWMKFTIGPKLEKELDSRPDGDSIRAQMVEQLQIMQKVFFLYLNKSKFSLVANEAFYDLGIGTGTIACNEGRTDDEPLDFSACPLRYYVPEEGPNGEVNTQWREMSRVPARNIPQLWPDATISTDLQQIINTRGETEIEILEGTLYQPETNDFLYIVIRKSSKEILFQETSPSSMWITFRWSRVANEVFGRGPAVDALPSVLTLNKMAEYQLTGAAFKAAPMYFGFTDGVFNPNTVKLRPNTIIPIAPGAAGAKNKPLEVIEAGGDVQFTQLTMTDLRDQINSIFFTDPLGPMDAPVKTATEISYRQKAFAEEVGPAFGRLQVEFLKPLVKRVLYILVKKGLFPPLQFDGKIIDFEFDSPLSQSVQAQNLAAFEQFTGNLQQVVGPQLAIAALNIEQVPAWLAEQYEVDMSLVKNPQQIQLMQQQLAQAQQQQAQLPQAGTAPQMQQQGA